VFNNFVRYQGKNGHSLIKYVRSFKLFELSELFRSIELIELIELSELFGSIELFKLFELFELFTTQQELS
jgi:hypothetical protein